ncbi:alanine--glyoxylate aminotransferase family protein [Pyrofollis japonicus]|uniref:pyridoxal-phosphate-dependent aminotransferase family protein n=1 Tax=Pyrofollis japonicus TaxID=3060460 RepID=UPI00295C0A46|nr:aminotransferase class V-fold PLP-dependent enzyme [Pyrofollis japonicus]BEP17425.1 alanine--glyoxylate aminotransferase family protein [Pyrofollis japonicus]
MAKLMTPGPIELHERVLSALAKPIISHRSQEFRQLLREIVEELSSLASAEEAYVLPGTGTTAVDAMVWSLIEPRSKVLALVGGEFGKRLAYSAEARGACVHRAYVDPRRGPLVEEVLGRLEEENYDYLLVVHNETSTGLAFRDVERLARLAERYGVKTLVDSVSGFPVEDIRLRNVYAVATATHKALAAPPGAAIVMVSREAVEVLEKRGQSSIDVPPAIDLARYHWFLKDRGETPFTAPITVMYGLREALLLVREKGVENIRREHRAKANILYDELTRRGYEAFVLRSDYRSATVAAFLVPKCMSALDAKKYLAENGYIVATGMSEYREKMLRIGVMGAVTKNDVETVAKLLVELYVEKCLV